jgi:hypothetical protein
MVEHESYHRCASPRLRGDMIVPSRAATLGRCTMLDAGFDGRGERGFAAAGRAGDAGTGFAT